MNHLDLQTLDPLTAVINDLYHATLAYLAVTLYSDEDEYHWRLATKNEFLIRHNLDELCGIDGKALTKDNRILCLDGVINGKFILDVD